MFLQDKDYFLACYALPPAQLKNRRPTVEGTFFGVERPLFTVKEAWNLVYEQPNHGSIERKGISHKKHYSAEKQRVLKTYL